MPTYKQLFNRLFNGDDACVDPARDPRGLTEKNETTEMCQLNSNYAGMYLCEADGRWLKSCSGVLLLMKWRLHVLRLARTMC